MQMNKIVLFLKIISFLIIYKRRMEIITKKHFHDWKISVYGTEDKPWFKANEVACILGLKNINENLRTIKEQHKTKISLFYSGTPHKIIYIDEPALYRLVNRSNKKEALDFQDWICEDVLPSIRKTGEYKMKKPYSYTILPSKFELKSEEDYHVKLTTYLRWYREEYLPILIINGQYIDVIKDKNERYKAITKGYDTGSPDITINSPTKEYNGCYIELKYGDNKLSDEQKYKLKMYRKNGYKIIISNEWTNLQRRVDKYLGMIRMKCDKCNRVFRNKKTLQKHYSVIHKKEFNLEKYLKI